MNQPITPRVRLIIIKENKILLSYVKSEDFYFFIGGQIEYGETIKQACQREIKEEANATFKFKKILYVRDYIKPKDNHHSLELYILGHIDKFQELEGLNNHQFDGDHHQTWVDLDKLPDMDIRPKQLVTRLLKDYQEDFLQPTAYLGPID